METALIQTRKRTLVGRQESLQRLLVYFALFLIIGFILFFIARKIAFVGFWTMDDVQIQNLLNGTIGAADGYCNTVNVLLGSFLAFLYKQIPSINWYGVFLLAMLMISCALSAAVLAQRLRGKTGIAIGFAIFSLIYMSVLYNFTFTVIAYIILACAFVCAAYTFFVKERPTLIFLWVCAPVLAAVAVMIRQDVILSASAVGAVFAVFLLIRYKKAALKTAGVICAMLILVFGTNAISNLLFTSDPLWNEYCQFGTVRVDLQDRFYPTYEQNQANFEKFGWSENDYNLFYTANIPDDPKFSTENLEKIDATYRNLAKYNLNLPDILASYWDLVSHCIPLVTLLAAAFVLALLSSKARLLSTAVFLLPFLMQAALVVIQRPLARVVVPHYYIAVVLLLCLIDSTVLSERFAVKAAKPRPLGLIAFLLALGISVYPLYSAFYYCTQLEEQRRDPHVAHPYLNQLHAFDYFARHKDKFYVYAMEPDFYSYSGNQSIFETKPNGYYANSFSLGGWAVRTKEYETFKKLAGVSSLPHDLIDNDNVCFVTVTKLEPYTKYFYETYHIPVKYEVVDNLAGGYQVLHVKTASSPAEMGVLYSTQ